MTPICPACRHPQCGDITIGSLFTGYGGLEMGIREVFPGARILWHCEHEPATKKIPNPRNAAARLLAIRHPDIPNLGDITAVCWAAVQRRLLQVARAAA